MLMGNTLGLWRHSGALLLRVEYTRRKSIYFPEPNIVRLSWSRIDFFPKSNITKLFRRRREIVLELEIFAELAQAQV